MRSSHVIREEDAPVPIFHNKNFYRDPLVIESQLVEQIEKLEESKDQTNAAIASHLRVAKEVTLVLSAICYIHDLINEVPEDDTIVNAPEEEEAKGKKSKGKKKKKASVVPMTQ